MPRRYVSEMVADWMGAGRALGKPDTQAWYTANRDRMILHQDTRRDVEMLLKGPPDHDPTWILSR